MTTTPGIAARLERLPLSWLHYRLLMIHGFGWLFDAFDVGLITFVVTALPLAWNLSDPLIGLINSAGTAGMCIGAAGCGMVADRWGRKRVFQVSLLVFAIATLLCAVAWSAASMIVFRFFVGLGLGGELPVVSSLMSEFVPGKHRGRFLVLLESFWAVGWFVAAVVASLVIGRSDAGWRIAFVIGALPACYVWVIRRKLPESPRWYESRGRHAEAERVMAALEVESERRTGPLPPPASVPPEREGHDFAFGELWRPAYLRRTIMLWILWFGLVFGYYGTFMWLPTLLVKAGYPLVKSYTSVILITLAQMPGIFSAAYLADRMGRKPVLIGYLVLTAGCAFMLGQASGTTSILVWASLWAFFNLGAWGAVYTYTPELYPTRARATGAGAAASFGRIGGIVGPVAVGLLLGPIGRSGVLLMNASMLVAAAVAVALLGMETRGRALEEISA